LKLNPKIIELILAYADAGFSSRRIAGIVGVSKSTVNNYIAANALSELFKPEFNFNRLPELQYHPDEVAFKKSKQGPRVLLFDLEVAGDIGLFFGRRKINISQDAIVTKGGYILCASWKYLGDSSVQSIHLTQDEVLSGDDFRITQKLYDLYSDADAVLCHNSKGYDHKVVQSRGAYWDMPALPTVKVLDTLELTRKNLRLPSNKLDSIAAYFNLPLKLDHSGISLWVNVQSGDEVAMQNMVEYCRQDVVVLEAVWNKLKQVGKAGSDFNAALYFSDEVVRCRTCGSENVEKTGRTSSTSSSVYDEYQCGDCGSVHRNKITNTLTGKRKNLLV
jgi:transposase-like protein